MQLSVQGRIQDFHLGAGGRKYYVPERTLRAQNPTHFRRGQARLRALQP